MNQQALATFLAAVLSAMAVTSVPLLSYRISRRDRRQNLDRDVELWTKMADGGFASRDGLKADIDRRIAEQLHGQNRIGRLVRICAVSAGIAVFGMVIASGSDTYVAGRSMRTFVISVVGWTNTVMTVSAFVGFMAALTALCIRLMVTRHPAGIVLSAMLSPLMMMLMAVCWLILYTKARIGSRCRPSGIGPMGATRFRPFMRDMWNEFRLQSPSEAPHPQQPAAGNA